MSHNRSAPGKNKVERTASIMKGLICVIAALVVLASNNASSKSSLVYAQDKGINVIKPAVKEGGWTIPGLEESQITGSRKLLQAGYGPPSIPLYVTVFKPKEKFITTIPIYRLRDGQLVISERKVAIDLIIKCDVNNRVFAYILQCTIILEESDGRTGYSGSFGVHYTDRDGDGKFESFEEGPPFVTADLRIPDWVLH